MFSDKKKGDFFRIGLAFSCSCIILHFWKKNEKI